jgi:acetylornithine/succinyldiaminopimelate/putrescine aminotransferase
MPEWWRRAQAHAPAFEAGLLVLPTGSRAIRLCPALTVSADEITVAVDILDQVCADLAAPVSH